MDAGDIKIAIMNRYIITIDDLAPFSIVCNDLIDVLKYCKKNDYIRRIIKVETVENNIEVILE